MGDRNLQQMQKLLSCAKPLIFDNRDPQFRYSIQGTCFMAEFRSRVFAITAKHCLRNRSYESVRIRLIHGNLEFLEVMCMVLPKTNDEDFLDLAVFELAPQRLPPLSARREYFLDLNDFSERTLSADDILAVVGYPAELNSADYDRLAIDTQGYSADGRYAGPAEEKHCSIMRFNRLEPLHDMNGLSGSPVLAFSPSGPNSYICRFAGVLIRGSTQSGLGTFINAPIVQHLLKRVTGGG